MASRKFSKETGTTKATSTKAKTVSKTPVRKTATKTSAKLEDKPVAHVIDTPIEKEMSETVSKPASKPIGNFKIKKSYVILALILIILALALFFGRSWLVAAVVNGQPVSRFAVIQETEKQSGKQALNNLVRNVLIEQEAKKQNVTVSDAEIDKQMKTVESNLKKQGQTLDQVLAMQGMTKDDLRKLIRLDQLVGKMVGKDIKISDKQVDDYIAKNKDVLGAQDQKGADLKSTVREQLKQQELNGKVQTWLANVQSKANILYFVNY